MCGKGKSLAATGVKQTAPCDPRMGARTPWKHSPTHPESFVGAPFSSQIWRPDHPGVYCPGDMRHFHDSPKVMERDEDAVSVMQESVDQLALSMFNSLRLIPFSEEVKGGAKGLPSQNPSQQQQQGQQQQQPVLRRAVKTNAAWASQVQSLAEGVLKKAKELDGLIDVLPGADLREDQQMEASSYYFSLSQYRQIPRSCSEPLCS